MRRNQNGPARRRPIPAMSGPAFIRLFLMPILHDLRGPEALLNDLSALIGNHILQLPQISELLPLGCRGHEERSPKRR